MTSFNYLHYQNLNDNEVLKIKLKENNEFLFVHKVSKSMLQSYQPAHTPITKINLEVIKDFELYKSAKDKEDNFYELRVEPKDVEAAEVIKIF